MMKPWVIEWQKKKKKTESCIVLNCVVFDIFDDE